MSGTINRDFFRLALIPVGTYTARSITTSYREMRWTAFQILEGEHKGRVISPSMHTAPLQREIRCKVEIIHGELTGHNADGSEVKVPCNFVKKWSELQ